MEFFRLSLLGKQLSLFSKQPVPSREAWLREIFSAPINFTHHKIQFHYVPDTEAGLDVIAGRLGRSRKSKENDPPEAGFKETERAAWKAMRILIDPTHHPDGQKVIIERDANVGKCFTALTALIKAINRRQDNPYEIIVEVISEAADFWGFVAEHKTITSVTFEYVAPNMFGIHDDIDADVRDAKAVENSNKVQLRLENREGLNVDTPRIRKSVEYTSRGTGKTKAVAKDRARFNSEDHVKTEHLPDEDGELSWNDLAKRVIRRIFDV